MKHRAAAWRMANVDDLRNLRYDWWINQRAPRTAVALYNHEEANGCNLVCIIVVILLVLIYSAGKSPLHPP